MEYQKFAIKIVFSGIFETATPFDRKQAGLLHDSAPNTGRHPGLPLYFGLSLAVVPILRTRLDVKFARGAENQSMLVETVTGIQTVKATALEPAFAKRWDAQLAGYVSASFKTQNLASVAHEGVNLIGKLVNAATLWYGAHLVMNNDMSVGQFVAFNMFAQRVSQPIMRMAQL